MVLLPNERPDTLYLTDGGLETHLIFERRLDLPHFAACDLLRSDQGTQVLTDYYERHTALAIGNEDSKLGFVLETPTWRANPDWCAKLGYSDETFQRVNRQGVELVRAVRDKFSDTVLMVISGNVGPRWDGYTVEHTMTVDEAQRYHSRQLQVFRETNQVDVVTALTMTNAAEAAGIVQAAKSVDLPVVISFTVETNGCLPSGESLPHAIEEVDRLTNGGPSYYMINCAHPTHFPEFSSHEKKSWVHRIGGIRANASSCSHAELDEATELDAGNPAELGAQYAELLRALPSLNVIGGCCGTDVAHIQQMKNACVAVFFRKGR